MFQYEGKIIAKGIVRIENERFFGGVVCYVDDIEVFDEGIMADEIRAFYQEFMKINSAAQRIPLGYLPEVLKSFGEKRKEKIIKLGENESFYCNASEGNRIEFPVPRSSLSSTLVRHISFVISFIAFKKFLYVGFSYTML